MSQSTFFLAIIVSIVAATSGMRRFFVEDEQIDLELEIRKKIAIERIKAVILEALNMTEPPVVADTPSRLSEAAMELMMEEYEAPLQLSENPDGLLFFPTNNDLQCLWHNTSSCRRFKYTIEDVIFSKAELRVFKLKSLSIANQTVFIQCKSLYDGRIVEHKKLLHEELEEKWLSIDLPFHTELNGNTICTIEVLGMTLSEVQDQPFLKMTQSLETHVRKRRSEDNPLRNETCRTIDFEVSFEEIGWGNFIVYPSTYNAKLCSGYCLQSSNFHETLVDLVFQRNQSLKNKFGQCWSTCCRPNRYATKDIVWKSSNNTQVIQTMTNMIVESCACT